MGVDRKPDIEAGAAVRAKKLVNRRTGATCRDFDRTWHARSYLRVEWANEKVRKTVERTDP